MNEKESGAAGSRRRGPDGAERPENGPGRAGAAGRALAGLLHALVILVYVLNAGNALQNHVDLAETDTTSFLDLACEIKAAGGLPGFWRDCLTGAYRETNQHPAYSLVLHPRAAFDPSFFVHAKVVSFVFGLATLGSLLWIVGRAAGAPVALLGGLLLAMNPTWANLTSMVACESMLAFAFLWTVRFLTRGDRGRLVDVATGLACGFAYMVKGTGIFLLPVIVVHLALFHRARALRSLAWVALGFTVAAFPLLARNTIVYGNPVYNVNTHVMWLDDWESVFKPEFRADEGRGYSFARYLREHTAADIGERLGGGVEKQLSLLRRLFHEPVLWRLERVWRPLLLAAFVAGAAFSWRRWGLPALLLAAGFFAFFTWYSAITTHARFWIPIVPVLYATIAWGFWRAACFMFERFNRRSFARPLFLAGAALLALLALRSGFEAKADWNWARSYELEPGFDALRGWMHDSFDDERILAGPSHDYPVFYAYRTLAKRHSFPLVRTGGELERYMRERKIKYAVVTREIRRRRGEALDDFLIWPDGGRPAIRATAADRWRIEMTDPSDPPNFAVLSFHPRSEGEAHDG